MLLPIGRVKIVQRLTCETPEFIVPTLWAANRPDLDPVDYRIYGNLQERVYHSRIHNVAQLKSHLIDKWENFSQMFN